MVKLRLVYSAEQEMKRKPAQQQRVYPQSITCWRCRTRFHGEEAKSVSDNDGVCDPCAEIIDSFPNRSEQHHGSTP